MVAASARSQADPNRADPPIVNRREPGRWSAPDRGPLLGGSPTKASEPVPLMLMVAHPPCTRLCNSGVRWLHEPPPGRTREDVWQELQDAAALFSEFWNAPIARIAIENPVMHRHAKALIRGFHEASQSVQPWQFGHPETKRTCFWLKGLPKLQPTNVVEGRIQRVARLPPSADRWKLRSETYPGIAEAMAEQWGGSVAELAA